MRAPGAVQLGQVVILLREPALKIGPAFIAVAVGIAELVVDLPADD
jgi:hypothetical protein